MRSSTATTSRPRSRSTRRLHCQPAERTRPASSTGSSAPRSARGFGDGGGREDARLREISDRLQAIAAIKGDVADDARRWSWPASGLFQRGGGRGEPSHPRGRRRIQRATYPEDLRSPVDVELERLRFSETDSTAGLDEAMRYSLLAGASGCARCSPSPPRAPSAPTRSASCRKVVVDQRVGVDQLDRTRRPAGSARDRRPSARAVARASTGRTRLPPAEQRVAHRLLEAGGRAPSRERAAARAWRRPANAGPPGTSGR